MAPSVQRVAFRYLAAGPTPQSILKAVGVQNLQSHPSRRNTLVGTLTGGGFREGGSLIVRQHEDILRLELPSDQTKVARSVLELYLNHRVDVSLVLTVRTTADTVKALFFSPGNIG